MNKKFSIFKKFFPTLNLLNNNMNYENNGFMENKKPTIFVLGKSKVGKSNFINSILKMNILPVSFEKSTKSVCNISYSDINYVRFGDDIFSNKEIKDCKIDDQKSFPTKINENFKKKKFDIIDRIEIGLNNENLKNINIVDTPGIEFFEQQKRYFFECDAFIYISNANEGLIETDLNYLKNLKSLLDKWEKIALVFNKFDLFKNDEENRIILEFIKKYKKEKEIDDILKLNNFNLIKIEILKLKNKFLNEKLNQLETFLMDKEKKLIYEEKKKINEIKKENIHCYSAAIVLESNYKKI